MKTKSTLRSFLCLAGTSLLTITYASATDYYWDTTEATAGWSTTATGTTWSSAGTGNLWSTSSTGEAATTETVTTTADNLYFGTAAISLGGTVTISGTVDANSVSTNNVTFPADSTINFSAEGTYERANNNMNFLAHTFTGLGTSLTWKSRRNMNVALVAHSAGKVILSTSPSTTFPYPGRTAMASSANLGATNAPLEFDGGTLRMSTGFPYTSLSTLNAAHPITWTADKDAGIDNSAGGTVFVYDIPIDLGTGAFWCEGNGGTSQFTVANNWSRLYLTSSLLEVSASNQLGPDAADVVFGSGDSTALGSGVLRIAGTTFSTFGARTLVVTDTKNAQFEIADATHTFTVDQPMIQTTGGLLKTGAGTLALTGTNTYTGLTNVVEGALGGTGIIAGDVDIQANAGLTFDLSTAPGSHTPLTVNGAGGLEFKGASELTLTFSGPAAVGTYTLATAPTGSITGVAPTTVNLPLGWQASAPYVDVNDLKIDITFIPLHWDSDGATAGFPNASGTWDSTGTGNAWSTDPSGQSAVLPDYVTTTSDYLCFGTPTFPIGGSVALSGTVNAGTILSSSGTFTAGTVNFGAEGTYIRANNNGSFTAGTTFTGNGTSLTWKSQRNLNVANVDTTTAAKIILSTSPTSPFPYPGRTVMSGTASVTLGAPAAELVFDHATLRMANGFPYGSLSALNTDHPVSFTANKDFGLEMVNSSFTEFTVDQSVNLGTGLFWVEGSRPIILTQPNTWGGVSIVGGNLVVSDTTQLGANSPSTLVRFGPGTTDLSGGTLTIAGTTLTDLGSRTFATTPDKAVAFDIVDGAHTFTLNSALEQASSTLTKAGLGTLALSGATNTYTGITNVNAGTLALIGGSHASPITVSAPASLGFTIGSPTTSTSSVNLTVGTVKISNPGAVDGSTSYLLMTATGFTFTDIAAQLGTAVPDYELQLQNGNTELWLAYAPSGSPFDTWAMTGTLGPVTFDGDTNGDGVKDGLAFLLGVANPDDDANSALPIVTEDGLGGLVLTFSCLNDASNGDATLNVEHSSDLGITDPWTAVAVPEVTTAPSSNVGFVVTGGSPLNSVVATIDSGAAASGKVFGRLRGEKP